MIVSGRLPTTSLATRSGSSSQTRQSRCVVPSSSVVSKSGRRSATTASKVSLMRRDGSP